MGLHIDKTYRLEGEVEYKVQSSLTYSDSLIVNLPQILHCFQKNLRIYDIEPVVEYLTTICPTKAPHPQPRAREIPQIQRRPVKVNHPLRHRVWHWG